MSRQEKRAFGDLRHRDRNKRLQQLLAAKSAKAKRQSDQEIGADALVIGVGPGLCLVASDGETRHVRCDLPAAAGDEVSIRHERVAAIAPRRTTLARTDPANPHRERVIAANIDLLLIVASIVDPPFRPGLVDRCLVAAARGGIAPVLCLNKIDLAQDTTVADQFHIPVVRCSARTGEGIADLRDLMAGSVAVLAGHSGVGKSSLLNALLDTAETRHARTAAVSEDTGKGRHTTTASLLYELRNGARIIDTPGIREFGLGRLTLEELRAAFPEFEGQACRFRDCTHREEPGCPVRHAGGPRYASWLRLAAEL